MTENIDDRIDKLCDAVTMKLHLEYGIPLSELEAEDEVAQTEAQKLFNAVYERRANLLRKNLKKKSARITIRIHEEDLMGLKERALQERMPYQSLVARLISKYLKGEMVVQGV